ncbi:hypothetical protein CYY_006514 [Polysphondylium violaceum]|uniref:Uncharacterized protein n=1 Tax=Polysphondylium violaceum TaxID=133409 RepID=A0A8J4PS42_9MYCE|nr:hypothetical protein CYY_006514 [Polysphondylium violaceum]
MIIKNLASFSLNNSIANQSNQQINSALLSSTTPSGLNQSQCYYIISLGGPILWINDRAHVHMTYFGHPH